ITLDARSESFRSPVNGIQLVYTDFLPIQLLSQPANTTTGPGGTFSFSVDAIGSGPRTIQWFSNNVAIPGAHQLTYTGTASAAMDGLKFHITVSNSGSSQTSDDATLTVAPVPVLISAGSLDSLTQVCLRFSKPLSADSLNTSHYALTPSVAINSAAFAASDPTVVILQTGPLTAG